MANVTVRAAQRGGGAATGADAEGRRAKRQARFEELKEKKKKKQASAKQQGPNASAAVAPVAGAPAGAAPAPATNVTAPVKLVALKRTDLVAGSITRLLDRKGGTEGGMIEMLDRILLDKMPGTPSQEQPCWWKIAVGECAPKSGVARRERVHRRDC